MKKNVKVKFDIKLNKNLYEGFSWKTKEEFFEQLVISHIAKNWIFYDKAIKEDASKKEQYEGLVQTLKEMKQGIKESIKYETLNTNENIENVRIRFSFNYYENTTYNDINLAKKEIFDNIIRESYFLAKEMPRMGAGAPKEKVKAAVKMYNHVGDFMSEAKNSLLINGIKVEEENEQKPKKRTI